MTSREAYLILNLLPGIGSARVKQLLQYYDSPELILKEKVSVLAKVQGIGSKLANIIANWESHADLEKEFQVTEKAGVEICTLSDTEYPQLLKEIYDPPLCLYVRGNVKSLNCAFPIAFVGSRRTTRYGIEIAERLTISAVKVGITIISGLARGIDTVTHTAAVEHDGTTIAVLGGGLGYIYPQENIGLARKICEKGALVTEYPMAAKPDRRCFPMRNRIIAGMSHGTVITEAGPRSGALITAQQAIDQGRQVFAVPGRVDSPLSRGCHYLIKDGAKLVETIDDILEEFNLFSQIKEKIFPEEIESSHESNEANSLQLSDNERIIIALLKKGEMSTDEIVQHSQISTQEVLSVLLGLEIKRLVVQLPGKRYNLNKMRKRVH